MSFTAATDTISFGLGDDSVSVLWPRLDMLDQYHLVMGVGFYNHAMDTTLDYKEFNSVYGNLLTDIRYIYVGDHEADIVQDHDPVLKVSLSKLVNGGHSLIQRRFVLYNSSIIEKTSYQSGKYALVPMGSVIQTSDGNTWTMIGENPLYSPLAKMWRTFDIYLSTLASFDFQYYSIKARFNIENLLDILLTPVTGFYDDSILGIGTDIVGSQQFSRTEVSVCGSQITDLLYKGSKSYTSFGGDGADTYFHGNPESFKGLSLWLIDQLIKIEKTSGMSIRTCLFAFNYRALAQALRLKTLAQIEQCKLMVGKLACIYSTLLQSTSKELPNALQRSTSQVIIPASSCQYFGLKYVEPTTCKGAVPLIKLDPKIYLKTSPNTVGVKSRTHTVDIISIEPELLNCYYINH
jgi:hypothetical protein